MSEEIIDVGGQFWPKLKEGTFVYTIEKPPVKNEGNRYVWKLSYVFKGQPECGEIQLFPNQMADLLGVLGFTKTDAQKYRWDAETCPNKKFKATAYNESDPKDLSKIYVRLKDYAEELQF